MINWLKRAAWFEAGLSIVRSIPEFTIGGGDSVVDSDLRMTGLDGPELRSRLLALLNRVPMVLITHANEEDRRRELQKAPWTSFSDQAWPNAIQVALAGFPGQ
jgi:CheY-like chemotaxis protein